jgi:membrane-associated phospholipid phosphatase
MKSFTNRQHWWQFVLFATILSPLLVAYDIPIAQLCYEHPLPRAVLRVADFNAYFVSNGFGVLAVLGTLLLLQRIKLSRLPQALSASLGAGLLADIVKLCVWRSRPNAISLAAASFSSTFHGVLPLLSAGSRGQSFPSGHAAVAAGFATTLSINFPRFRWLFVPLGVAAALSRVLLHVHFATDVFVGATLGTCWGLACHSDWSEFVFERIQSAIENLTLRPVHSSKSIAASKSVISPDLAQPVLITNSDQGRAA